MRINGSETGLNSIRGFAVMTKEEVCALNHPLFLAVYPQKDCSAKPICLYRGIKLKDAALTKQEICDEKKTDTPSNPQCIPEHKNLNQIIDNKLNTSVLESIQDVRECFLGSEISNKSEKLVYYLGNHFYKQCNSIQLKIIPSGSDYYDGILKRYATYLENIKPFDENKILEYVHFINRMLYPNSINLIPNNCSDKNFLHQCCATLSFIKTNISANFDLNSEQKALLSQDSKDGFLYHNNFSIKYKDQWFKNSRLDYELKSNYSSNNQHKIKYTKLFEVSPTKFISTSVSYDNYDYLADIHGLDNLNNFVNNELTNENNKYRNYSSSNLVLSINYTTLNDHNKEYTVGYANRYAKYRHNFGLEKNHIYNINNIYTIIRLHELGVSFYLGNEFSFNEKYRNTVAAVFYKKDFKDYFFNSLLMYGDRKMNDDYKAKYYNSELKMGKTIDAPGRTFKYIIPSFSLNYISILGYGINNKKLNKNTKNKLQKVVGVTLVPKNKVYNKANLNFSYWQINNAQKGVSFSINLNF
ncbi:hypothetical protein [Candidatus Aquarickettsia rohweri]|uniref:Uncharacterized protein n=1 Tax=Candidatus Aquarickettsia rohweri TaxID=2602574 RepID=A0A429XH09_9RICK|nr:hypothetical protein [Candidatus Aquarickettsia rohweri]RST64476.1 hypothetical protein EIC27_04705 [Candidatus Aquarickettsia rohweri]